MAQMTTAGIDDLPDSDFAYIEPGGKVVDGRTEPRSLRHFPIHDAAHVRNALARLAASPFGEKARPAVEAAAKRMGIGEGKATALKAEPMTTTKLEQWLDGKIPRRILVLPFGGPIPSAKSSVGVDLDGEWFDADTDIYGAYPSLRQSRERVVDWHHDNDPTGYMKGAILGRVDLDEENETLGRYGQFWANAGEKRRRLIAWLEERGHELYGSSQAIPSGIRKAESGHIDIWPLFKHTISTSPQNTWADVPAMKAVLDNPTPAEITVGALKALMAGFEELRLDLPLTLPDGAGDAAAKAGARNSRTDASLMQQAHDNLASVLSLDCASGSGKALASPDLDDAAAAVSRMVAVLAPR